MAACWCIASKHFQGLVLYGMDFKKPIWMIIMTMKWSRQLTRKSPWSRGMIPASGAGGPGFDSRRRPLLLGIFNTSGARSHACDTSHILRPTPTRKRVHRSLHASLVGSIWYCVLQCLTNIYLSDERRSILKAPFVLCSPNYAAVHMHQWRYSTDSTYIRLFTKKLMMKWEMKQLGGFW